MMIKVINVDTIMIILVIDLFSFCVSFFDVDGTLVEHASSLIVERNDVSDGAVAVNRN